MEDVLKRLLETETRAEAILAEAEAGAERLVEQARADAATAEARFRAEADGRRAPLLRDAEERAGEREAELVHAFEARKKTLRDEADRNEGEAVKVALALLLDPER